MPTYEYRCRKGHTFEVIQSMSDDPITACQQCRAPVERVFHPVAVHFKGSGFYTTDYGRKRSPGSDGGGGDAKSDSKEATATKSDTKSDGSGESSGDKSKSTSGDD